MDKVMSAEQAVSRIHDGATVMIGGFGGSGSPQDVYKRQHRNNSQSIQQIQTIPVGMSAVSYTHLVLKISIHPE